MVIVYIKIIASLQLVLESRLSIQFDFDHFVKISMKKCVIPPGELKRLLTFRWSNVAENFYPAELLKKCTIQRIINEARGEKNSQESISLERFIPCYCRGLINIFMRLLQQTIH